MPWRDAPSLLYSSFQLLAAMEMGGSSLLVRRKGWRGRDLPLLLLLFVSAQPPRFPKNEGTAAAAVPAWPARFPWKADRMMAKA